MSHPDIVELSSPYSSNPYLFGSGFGSESGHQSPTRSFRLGRKGSSVTYDPILTPQDEYDRRRLRPGVNSLPPASTNLGPGRVGKFGVDLILEVILCTLAVGASVPFIWLAVVVSRYDHDPVTEHKTNYIRQATSTISTLFTILFAAVLGSTLKRFATWRLERGIRLGLLEQIMQSRTVFSALTAQLSLRNINAMSLVLLVCWTCSPLGSQASLRLFSTGIELSTSSGLVSYPDTITNQVFDGVSGVDSLMTALKPTYISSMLASNATKSGTMDLWGNVKIPWLDETLPQDQDGWTDLSNTDIPEGMYSSLVGLPVSSLANRNSSFSIETTYMTLDCKLSQPAELVDINYNVTAGNGTFLGANATRLETANVIYPFWRVAMNQFVNNNLYFYGYPELLVNVTDNDLPQATFLFQTRGPWVSRCKINQEYVESNVSCRTTVAARSSSGLVDVGGEGGNTLLPSCAVLAQRKSTRRHSPSTVTTFSFPTTFDSMASYWIMATDPLLSSAYSSLSEYYLQNTSASFILSGNGRTYADYSDVSDGDFSHRLAQLMNTWVLGGQVSADTMAFYGLDRRTATVVYTDAAEVYVVSRPWLAAYCASTAVMLVAALVGIYCAFDTTVPDVLGYCSTLTRDSRHFAFARGGSTLDGAARTRLLGDLRLKMGEVVVPSPPPDDDNYNHDNSGGSSPHPHDDILQAGESSQHHHQHRRRHRHRQHQQQLQPFRNDFVNDFSYNPRSERAASLAIAPPEYVKTPKRGMLYS
ncbi:hypothetical protein PV08_09384 [Exophiala spinifera]|uniref:Transmembrane protein n=1 Tax=Exophiala spinifera TaxID=91928 RepID=A0A0D2B087_9EURO|nr:uncharacterized protein PV08_09384 [Exophiala spinifera]KIW12110.1 hypothetical protein PV08_09384 [Exophiala spinifera]